MHSIYRPLLQGAFALIVLSLLLSACRSQAVPSVTPTAPAQATQPATAAPLPATPTASPRSLVICLGQEPQSLYLYSPSIDSMWSVLEAVYDGPIDNQAYSLKPVILQKIPSLTDKDVIIQTVTANAGDEVIDANGDLVTLAKGVKILPSGCAGGNCAVTFDGKTPVKMDQMSVTFKLLAGLTWSDGKPLTASDSIYSYNLAADPATPVSKYRVNRTADYKAVDALTVLWTGKPGLLDPDFANNFWLPLPEHLWGQMKPADLLQAEASAQKPVGWGPYVIDSWVKGDHISLHKNSNYFRAKEGLPKFDQLVFRFVGQNATDSVNALLAGECDVVDESAHLEEQLPMLSELQQAKKLQTSVANGPEWEHIDFGIKPASYDDSYNPAAGDRPDLFGDVRTRQAFADCMDRQGIVDQLLLKQSFVPDSFLSSQNPLHASKLQQYPFDPSAGEKLLDEVGWSDDDHNPATPRVAKGVTGVPDGSLLSVTYATTQAALRTQVADRLAKSLGGCGIHVNVQTFNPSDLFATGPQGLLFGRHFDLAEFSWEAGARPACSLYQSSRVPNPSNQWVGENISGYANPKYDTACQSAGQLIPGQTGYEDAQAKTQEIFAADLPVVPLYLSVKVSAARPDFCGLKIDPTTRSGLWNIESFDDGSGCSK